MSEIYDSNIIQGFGWFPDYPDFRDYTVDTTQMQTKFKQIGEVKSVKNMLAAVGIKKVRKTTLADSIDLREWCSPIKNQGRIGSCTANAGAGLIEYFEKKAFGKHIEASRLFLYKATRNLLHWEGDTGAFLRTTMAAMALFGAPPEEYWEYNIEKYDTEPTSFCYSFAQNYQAIQYFRLDPPNTKKIDLLTNIKSFLLAGLPLMFGFTVFNSINSSITEGKIPFPGEGEKIIGGHAVIAVGYNDKIKIENITSKKITTGALLIRNSWGTDWGEKGYGWLPYDFVLTGLAIDWWNLLKNEWINTNNFGL